MFLVFDSLVQVFKPSHSVNLQYVGVCLIFVLVAPCFFFGTPLCLVLCVYFSLPCDCVHCVHLCRIYLYVKSINSAIFPFCLKPFLVSLPAWILFVVSFGLLCTFPDWTLTGKCCLKAQIHPACINSQSW